MICEVIGNIADRFAVRIASGLHAASMSSPIAQGDRTPFRHQPVGRPSNCSPQSNAHVFDIEIPTVAIARAAETAETPAFEILLISC
jgi:hypothetical protein